MIAILQKMYKTDSKDARRKSRPLENSPAKSYRAVRTDTRYLRINPSVDDLLVNPVFARIPFTPY
jgi:hypothetical protein